MTYYIYIYIRRNLVKSEKEDNGHIQIIFNYDFLNQKSINNKKLKIKIKKFKE